MYIVAIVGRPNVGKSTLFNRLAGRRLALVDDTPGLTRDRREAEARLFDLTFRIIDTAGFEDVKGEVLEARMRAQTEAAIEEADICLLLIDARAGVTALDEFMVETLRSATAKVLLLANKCEGTAGESGIYESYALGMDDPIVISAEHGEGMRELYDALRNTMKIDQETLPSEGEEGPSDHADTAPPALRIAVVGRPNVGKSTLVNQLLGEQRLLTGPEAGITRDAISVDWQWQGRQIKLYDTAGMRRRSRVADKLEKLSVSDTLRAIRFAEVVILLIDVASPFEKQNLQIADLINTEGRAMVIAVNKWDLEKDRERKWRELTEQLERLLPQMRGIPLIKLSALTGQGTKALMDAVARVYEDWNARVKTPELNRWLAEMADRHPPPIAKGRRIRLRYMSQIKTRPPTFVLFASNAAQLPDSYRRYLVNGLREAFDIQAVPIRLRMRQGKNPFAPRR